MRNPTSLNLLAIVGAILSMITTIIYGTWFISGIEKRVSLLESQNQFLVQKISDIKQASDQANEGQDNDLHRFQDNVDAKLTRVEDKIEKIYTLMTSKS
jgi:uncharacterized protein YjcR